MPSYFAIFDIWGHAKLTPYEKEELILSCVENEVINVKEKDENNYGVRGADNAFRDNWWGSMVRHRSLKDGRRLARFLMSEDFEDAGVRELLLERNGLNKLPYEIALGKDKFFFAYIFKNGMKSL